MSARLDRDDGANQCNPNNDAYWQRRDLDEQPSDWEDRITEDDTEDEDDD